MRFTSLMNLAYQIQDFLLTFLGLIFLGLPCQKPNQENEITGPNLPTHTTITIRDITSTFVVLNYLQFNIPGETLAAMSVYFILKIVRSIIHNIW